MYWEGNSYYLVPPDDFDFVRTNLDSSENAHRAVPTRPTSSLTFSHFPSKYPFQELHLVTSDQASVFWHKCVSDN